MPKGKMVVVENEEKISSLIKGIDFKNVFKKNSKYKDKYELILACAFKCDDIKYETENCEYTVNELEMRVDEIEAIDIEDLKYDLKSETDSLKEEVNEVLTNFESMTEGYTVSVKLNPPLS